MLHSAAMTSGLHERLVAHLLREDGQEDVCFALWRPSTGGRRTSAIVFDVMLPEEGERDVHCNASFSSAYFLRAANQAAEVGAGVALVHSHPGGRGWQDMSRDDVAAERAFAAQARVLCGVPLVGMTIAGRDESWSARSWLPATGGAKREDCMTVRVVGDQLKITRHPNEAPAPKAQSSQLRTVSAWGVEAQADLARLHVGVVGLGSVGALVAESLARVGVGKMTLVDFDVIEEHNLDRVLHAHADDVAARRSKVALARVALLRSATHPDVEVHAVKASVCEPEGWQAGLDCDVLFSCVDRPWPRHALNGAAYSHLIPVIDGGIRARTSSKGWLTGAEWRAHIAAPGRRCLQCLGQYHPADVTTERQGLLDDPKYIEGLPQDHPLRARQNVFAFAMSAASFEVLQLITMVVAPSGKADVGAQLYHAVAGVLDVDVRDCEANCLFSGELLAQADMAPSAV